MNLTPIVLKINSPGPQAPANSSFISGRLQRMGANEGWMIVELTQSWATLPRQRDHVFRPKMLIITLCLCLLRLLYTKALTFFGFFLVTGSILRCRVVVVAKLDNCRVPSSG